ncbi:MAG: gephyrin-like molybdotransferase Glp [Phormidesmis sp.]
MFSAAEAERLILTLAVPISEMEAVDTREVSACLGRVVAAPALSQLDFPHWDNSAMDGYAVRQADVKTAPVTLQVVEEIPAGTRPRRAIESGQAARILTGAMIPPGADTVVMQEETVRQGDRVSILQVPEWQSFVRQQGSYARAGDELLALGRTIGPAEIALLAAAQQRQVLVYRRPRIAVISTGNELARLDQPLQPGQIVDSNQYALWALVAQTGAVPVPLGIVPDDREAVKAAIASALSQSDMVLSSGGVSVGDYDYVDDVLAELGATIHIRSVAVKPGKPLTVASFDAAQSAGEKLYFGLPGNPASAMVGFWRFVAGAIAKLSGRQGPWSPEFVWAKALTTLHSGGGRETYLWGQLVAGAAGYEFSQAAGGHSSGNLVNLPNTSGLGVLPQGETQIEAGAPVKVLRIR